MVWTLTERIHIEEGDDEKRKSRHKRRWNEKVLKTLLSRRVKGKLKLIGKFLSMGEMTHCECASH